MEELSKIIQIITSAITSLGIIIGAIWSYHLFIKNRQKYPKSIISHSIDVQKFPDEKNLILTINVIIQNTGKTLLKINSYIIELLELYPSDDFIHQTNSEPFQNKGCAELSALKKIFVEENSPKNNIELEPSESEKFTYIVVINSKIKAVELSSFFSNPMKNKRGLGWHERTTHNLTISSKNNKNVQ